MNTDYIEAIQERIEREMESALMAMDDFDLRYREGHAEKVQDFGGWSVVDEMDNFDTEAMETGIKLLAEDPIEGARWLMAYKKRCVKQIVGRAKTYEAAEYKFEKKTEERRGAFTNHRRVA